MLTLTLWMRKEETMEGKCLAKITEWWKQASHHFALKFPHTFHWQHRCSGSPSARGQAAVLPTHVPHRLWGVWTPALVQLLGPLSRGRMSGSWHCHPMSLWVGPPFVTLLGLYLLKQGDWSPSASLVFHSACTLASLDKLLEKILLSGFSLPEIQM